MRCAALEKLWIVRSTDSSMAGFLNFARILSASFTNGRSTFSTSWGFSPPTAMTNTRPPTSATATSPSASHPGCSPTVKVSTPKVVSMMMTKPESMDSCMSSAAVVPLPACMPLRVAVAMTSDVPARFIEGATVFMKKVPNTSESPVR